MPTSSLNTEIIFQIKLSWEVVAIGDIEAIWNVEQSIETGVYYTGKLHKRFSKARGTLENPSWIDIVITDTHDQRRGSNGCSTTSGNEHLYHLLHTIPTHAP